MSKPCTCGEHEKFYCLDQGECYMFSEEEMKGVTKIEVYEDSKGNLHKTEREAYLANQNERINGFLKQRFPLDVYSSRANSRIMRNDIRLSIVQHPEKWLDMLKKICYNIPK